MRFILSLLVSPGLFVWRRLEPEMRKKISLSEDNKLSDLSSGAAQVISLVVIKENLTWKRKKRRIGDGMSGVVLKKKFGSLFDLYQFDQSGQFLRFCSLTKLQLKAFKTNRTFISNSQEAVETNQTHRAVFRQAWMQFREDSKLFH
jgi:hypothetical protein